jgi:hypothetical protein
MIDLDYLVGASVGLIEIGSGVTLSLFVDAGQSKLDAGRVRYEPAGGSSVDLDTTVEEGADYAPLLALYRRTITNAHADDRSSTLELRFDNGDRLTALPMEGVEGWHLEGPGSRFTVAVAGGGVAVWD